MSIATALQIFLYVNVFVIGALTAIIVRHYQDHKHRPEPEAEKPRPARQEVHLSAAAREHLLEESQTKFEAALDNTASRLQQDLAGTADKMNKLVEQLGTVVIGNELEHYRTELIQLRKQAEVSLGKVSEEVAAHQADLKAQLAKEIEVEKQMLVQQIDTKLGDAVAAFLLETLQHNVDLGAQKAYLTSMLEEHKADFKKEVADENQAA
jgi:predicted  nucleic acid-binding Zn-ribbon protein